MEEDLVKLLTEQRVSCRLWPEQTEGPYHRDVRPERRDITESRDGRPLRLALRLLDAGTGSPLSGALVEIWQADHEGRYSGFPPFRARPGQVVTSESVPRDVVAVRHAADQRGGNRSLTAMRRALSERGRIVMVAPQPGHWIGPIVRIAGATFTNRLGARRAGGFMAGVSRDDLMTLAGMIETGKLTPVIERIYPFEEIPHSVRHLESALSARSW